MRKLLVLTVALVALFVAGVSVGGVIVPFDYAVSLDLVPGFDHEGKYARIPDIDAGETEDVWAATGSRTWLTSADTHDFVSTDADDTSAGTGCRTVDAYGVNGSKVRTSETVTMNGATPVTTLSSYLNIYRARCATAGTSGANEGTISFSTNTGAIAQGSISPGDSSTLLSHYTVGSDTRGALITGAQFSVGRSAGNGAREAAVRLFTRDGSVANAAWVLRQPFQGESDGGVSPDAVFQNPLFLPAGTDLYWEAEAFTNNTSVTLQYNLLIRE